MSEGSLLRLFNCENFTLEMLIEYLYKSIKGGVLSFLINKLYSYPIDSYQMYIPQLLNICFFKEGCADLETVLLRASIDSHAFALTLHFHLIAFVGDCKDHVKLRAREFLENLDMAVVNASMPKQASDSAPPYFFGLDSEESDIDGYIRKSTRAEYFSYQLRITDLLCKISVGLSQITSEFRDSKLVHWLEGANDMISSHRKKKVNTSKSSSKLFRGPVLGFKFHSDPDSGTSQVVRILYEKSLCFATKARVPYKLVYETIDINEELTASESISIRSVDEEVFRDIAEVDDETLQKMVHKEVRFEGYSEFVEKVEKEHDEIATPRSKSEGGKEQGSIWGDAWRDVVERVKENSNYGKYPSWKLRAIIVKGLDDLRQEFMAMQLITKIRQIWEGSFLSLYLRTYDIRVISDYTGMIEFIPDTLSIHSIKKNYPNFKSLLSFFKENWGPSFEEAQRNFVQSMAGYSLVCYLLNLKDRHNGNILIDALGHIIHIDFGFFLTTSPGNMGFESAPFKLTYEMVEVMEGTDGEMFGYFKILLLQGFLEVRKHANALLMILEAMGENTNLACLQEYQVAVDGLKHRLQLNLTDEKCFIFIEELVYLSLGNWRTMKYDDFQYLTNGIL